MTKKTNTKRALLMSALALLLCVSMLVGSTFAWFTDSVVSGSNVIQAGNLDLDVQYTLDGEKWADLQDAKDLFKKGLWEPGHTEVVVLKLENKGSLALKYTANMNIVNETKGITKDGKDIVLSDILQVSTLTFEEAGIDPSININIAEKAIENAFKTENGIAYDAAVSFKKGNVLEDDNFLTAGMIKYIAIKVDMPETVGNEANAKDKNSVPSIEFGVNVLATQYTYEEDSFGTDYDAKAEYPNYVYNDKELDDAIKAGETEITLANGTFHMPASAKGKTLTINGTHNSIIEVVPAGQGEANGQLDYNLDGSTVTFNGVTIKTNNQTYAGYARLNATYNNCVFDNCYCLNGDSVFTDCTFNVSGDQYNVWTWGAPTATFTGCTFNSDGKALLLYGTANTKLTVNGCTFNDTGVLPDLKAAIEIGNEYNKSYELIVNNTTVNGYEINDKGINTGTTLWANKNSMGTDKLNVVVNGVDVY